MIWCEAPVDGLDGVVDGDLDDRQVQERDGIGTCRVGRHQRLHSNVVPSGRRMGSALAERLIASFAAAARVLVEELMTADVTRISTARARKVRQVFLYIPNISSPFLGFEIPDHDSEV